MDNEEKTDSKDKQLVRNNLPVILAEQNASSNPWDWEDGRYLSDTFILALTYVIFV